MTGIVCKLDQRQTSAVVHLCGEHKTNLFRRLFRGKMNHTLNVLYGIAVTVAVAQTAVNQGRCARPCKGHEAVVGIPCVDHAVHFCAGGMDLEIFQFGVPVCLQRSQLLRADRSRVCIACHECAGFLTIFGTHDKRQMCRFSGVKHQYGGQCAAGVFVVVHAAVQLAGGHALGVTVAVIAAKKVLLVAAIPGNALTRQTKQTVAYILVVYLFAVCGNRIQIAVDELQNVVILKLGACNELGILQIDLILLIVRIIRKFGIAGHSQFPHNVRVVAYSHGPDLMGGIQRHIVEHFRGDSRVEGAHFCVGHAVSAFAFVAGQILADRLPRG